MKIIEKIENGSYCALKNFNDEQLKILVEKAYTEGFDDGEFETKSKILNALGVAE